jgi:uncharacterized protein YcaQ
MPPRNAAPLTVSAETARRLLMHAQGLLHDRHSIGTCTPKRVTGLIERMGFVQVDTISTVERAHHLILAARMAGYRHAHLATAIERDRSLFEHWTHDASIIPTKFYAHWKPRFERFKLGGWHLKRLGGDAAEAERVISAVLTRIEREGPLASKDFEHPTNGEPTNWWGWKPPKVALNYLWRSGVLHVTARRNFHKVYDLSERVVPEHAAVPAPTEAEHVDWACRTSLERLGTATAREIAQFWNAVSLQQVKAWLPEALASGVVRPVTVEAADGSPPVAAFALADLAKRVARLPDPPSGVRLLSPFDPVLRDRARAKRLFGFDFRFEGFVPAAERKHGYYVMAILDGDRFIGRADPKFDRAAGVLRIKYMSWEPGVRLTKRSRAAFEEGVASLASWIGAKNIDIDLKAGRNS